MDAAHFFRLQALVSSEVARFDKTLAKLRSAHFPSNVARELIDDIRVTLSEQQESICRIVEDFEHDPEGAFDRLKSEHRKMVGKLRFLDAIENARTDEVPWSIIPTIERLASRLMPKQRLLTTATAQFNYAIQWPIGIAKGRPIQFPQLFLPKVHRANAFLHLLIGHELFHPLLEEFFVAQQPHVSPVLRDGCLQILKSLGVPDDDLWGKQRLDQLIELAIQFWRRALEEVMCDLGCAAIFGPAAVFSSTLFALTQSLDERPTLEGECYPPWRYRLRTLMAYAIDTPPGKESLKQLRTALSENNLDADKSHLDTQLQAVRNLTADLADTIEIARDPFLKLAYESVATSLQIAAEYVERQASVLGDLWPTTVGQVPALLRCLDARVPPGEIRSPGYRLGKPAAVSAIAIAGWLFQLRSEFAVANNQLSVSVERQETFQTTCRLLLKAFEDSELRHQFDSAQKA